MCYVYLFYLLHIKRKRAYLCLTNATMVWIFFNVEHLPPTEKYPTRESAT